MKMDLYRYIYILYIGRSIFNSNWIRRHRGLEEGNRNLGKRLEWKNRDET